MIDHVKLDTAFKLAIKLSQKTGMRVDIDVAFLDDDESYSYTDYSRGIVNSRIDIDELIAKLKELTKPEPKYKVGQKVWFFIHHQQLENNKIYSFEIKKIHQNEFNILYSGEYEALEQNLYPTKEALIQDQIDYWQVQLETLNYTNNLKNELDRIDARIKNTNYLPTDEELVTESSTNSEKCEHYTYQPINDKKLRCIKCGEFFDE